jgi:cytochrome b561
LRIRENAWNDLVMRATAASPDRYGAVAIVLHWAIAALILVNWPLGYFGEGIERLLGASQVALHKSIGLTVLGLSVLRLLWRLGHPVPPLPESIARWRAVAARFTHAAFYVLIIAMPVTGWLRISSGKYPLTWFGLIDLPKFPIGTARRRSLPPGRTSCSPW